MIINVLTIATSQVLISWYFVTTQNNFLKDSRKQENLRQKCKLAS